MVRFVISCDTCVTVGNATSGTVRSATCADCVVTHLLSPARREPLAFDEAELRAVQLLAAAGLVPTLRHCEAV